MILDYIYKSPYRNQLEDYLKDFLPKLNGKILDIGSKNRRYDYLLRTKPLAIDIVENIKKEVKYGDVNKLNFEDESFDSILCIEVLEYLTMPREAISEIYRVLKKEGTLILSVPFMYKVHQDQMRFTKNYLKKELFAFFSQTKIYPVGNFYTIVLDILRGKIKEIKFTFLRYLCYPFYLFLVLFIPLSRISKNENYISGYFVVAKK